MTWVSVLVSIDVELEDLSVVGVSVSVVWETIGVELVFPVVISKLDVVVVSPVVISALDPDLISEVETGVLIEVEESFVLPG